MTAASTEPQVSVSRRGGGVWYVEVHGVIDERWRGDAVTELTTSRDPAIFNLDGVERISSFGVREWMRSLAEIRSSSYFFIRCRPSIVAQFNSVSHFGASGQVVSLYAPYVCLECDQPFDVLLDLRETQPAALHRAAPAARCPACKEAAEFDDLEDIYFSFVIGQPPLQLPPKVSRVLDEGSEEDRPFRLAKEVYGDLTAVWLRGTVSRRARLTRYLGTTEGRLVIVLRDAKVDADGLLRLAEVVDGGSETYFARTPVALIEHFRPGGALAAGCLFSVTVRAVCRECGDTCMIEVGGTNLPASEPRPCGACNAPGALHADLSEDDERSLEDAPFQNAPESVHHYLEARTELRTDAASPEHSSVEVEAHHGPVGPGARIGKYTVLSKLGAGGMAEVFLGRQEGPEGFEKKVVIKRVLPHLATSEDFVDLFLQEARLAARINSSHVVQIYDLHQESGDYYIVMEYIQGADLNAAMRATRAAKRVIPVAVCCRVVSDVLSGLRAAHSQVDSEGKPAPILHRDVTPHNVMVGLDGIAKLADFGVAKATDSANLTMTGTLKGKLIYISPEVVKGEAPTPTVDVFAAGLVAYTSLTLTHPFHRSSEILSLHALLEEDVPPLRKARPDVDEELDAIIMKAIEKDPSRRYDSAEAFQRDLDRYVARHPDIAAASAQDVGDWLSATLADVPDSDGAGADERGGTDKSGSTATLTTPAKLVVDGEPYDSTPSRTRGRSTGKG